MPTDSRKIPGDRLCQGPPASAITAQNTELVAKNEDFGLQCHPRPEQPGYSAPDEPEEFAHRADYRLIRGMTSAVEFPVGTTVNVWMVEGVWASENRFERSADSRAIASLLSISG